MPDNGNQGKQVQKPAENAWYKNGAKFTVTHYSYAVEEDPFYETYKQTELVEVPELDHRKFTRGFLGIDKNGAVLPASKNAGVTMQGSGRTKQGDHISYVNSKGGKAKFRFGLGGRFATVNRPFEQIAVDPKVISKGSKVYVEHYDRVMSADDIGSKIKGNHIDVFVGPMPFKKAARLGTKRSRLGIVDKKAPKGGSASVATKAPAKDEKTPVQEKTKQVPKEGTIHIVSSGETLASIAKDYNVKGGYKALVAYNGMANPRLIHVGQEIAIPGTSNVSAKASRPVVKPNPHAVHEAQSGKFIEHTVGKSETLASIAKKYKVEGGYMAIVNANNMRNPNVLRIGQKLCVPVK